MKTGGVSEVIFAVSFLLRSHFTKVFTFSCSALKCAEPIVVRGEGFARDVKLVGEERGAVVVTVLVVRNVFADAESVAVACERVLREARWDSVADCGQFRVCGVDLGFPSFREQDRSGRYVWGLDVAVKVVREL